MNNGVLGVGAAEALLILLIAGVVLGPRRLVGVAFSLGRQVRELNLYSKRILGDLRQELAALDDAGESLGKEVVTENTESAPEASPPPDAEAASDTEPPAVRN